MLAPIERGKEAASLHIFFPYSDGSIEKVSYQATETGLDIITIPTEGLQPEEEDVVFTRGYYPPPLDEGQLKEMGRMKDRTTSRLVISIPGAYEEGSVKKASYEIRGNYLHIMFQRGGAVREQTRRQRLIQYLAKATQLQKEAFSDFTDLQFETDNLFDPSMPSSYDLGFIGPLKVHVMKRMEDAGYMSAFRNVEKIAVEYRKEIAKRMGFRADVVSPVQAEFARELQSIREQEDKKLRSRCKNLPQSA